MSKSIVVVSGLAVNAEGKMLMTHRHPHKLRPSMWEHPGGKVDAGETLHGALCREWREELGVEVLVGPCLGSWVLEVEITLHMNLFSVTIMDGQTPHPLESTGLAWVEPLEAIKHLPCTPSTYLYHRAVAAFVFANARQ